jgi:hypothetical protein
MTPDTAFNVARDERAPAEERAEAHAELQKAALSSELIPQSHLMPLIEFIREQHEEQEFQKSLSQNKVIPFPSRAARERQPGMQSVYLDDGVNGAYGEYYEKPGAFSFDFMRQMVAGTDILSAIVLTRVRQVQRFCRQQENGKGPGFEIRMRDRDANASTEQTNTIKVLQDFFSNCGMESNPRQRARLRRDNFTSFMGKLTRDSLTMDSSPIETEFKRDKKLGMDGIYAVDGATIRLCTELGYRDNDEIRALQVVQGQLRAAYTFDDLIYVPRNPRSDVLVGGYGMSETEMLIKTVTNILNAVTYNGKFFDSNSIPKGLLHLSGNYDQRDLAAFKRQWNGMVKGINNSWAMPVMVSKDQESKASFEKFGIDIDEMAFAKWLTFLTSIACAIYGISPDEINMEAFSTRNSGLSGNDTEEKLAHSADKGLRPLLSYFEDLFTDYIVSDFSDQFVFRWTGLDEEDEKQRFERQKLILTVNELRAMDSLEPIEEQWGSAPLNPSLIGPWQAEQQQGQEDYGQPGADGQAEAGDGGGEQQDDQGGGAPDFGDGGDQDFGDAPAGDGSVPADPNGDPADFAKSFGLPVFRVET